MALRWVVLGVVGAGCVAGGAAHAQTVVQTSSSGQMDAYEYTSDGRRNDSYSTRVRTVVDGVVFGDQHFNFAIETPAVAAAVEQMRRPVAMGMNGAPGVVTFGQLQLIDMQEEFLDSFTEINFQNFQTTIVTVTRTSGDGPDPVVPVGDRFFCFGTGTNGDTNFGNRQGRFADCDQIEFQEAQPGEIIENTHTTFINTTVEASFTNEDYLNILDWQIFGATQLIGTIHASSRTALYDAGQAFVSRIGLPREGDRPRDGFQAWVSGVGVEATSESVDGVAGSTRDVRGLQAGASFTAGDISVGAAIDQSDTDIAAIGAPERATAELIQAGGHVRYGREGWFAQAAVSQGQGDVETQHGSAALGGVSLGVYDATVSALSLSAGRRIEMGPLSLTPFVGHDFVRLSTDGFTETGGMALTAPEHESQRAAAWIGAAGDYQLFDGGGWAVSIGGRARAFSVEDGRERTLPVAFAATPTDALMITGVEEEGRGVDWRGSLTLAVGDMLSAQVSGEVTDGDVSRREQWSASLVMRW